MPQLKASSVGTQKSSCVLQKLLTDLMCSRDGLRKPVRRNEIELKVQKKAPDRNRANSFLAAVAVACPHTLQWRTFSDYRPNQPFHFEEQCHEQRRSHQFDADHSLHWELLKNREVKNYLSTQTPITVEPIFKRKAFRIFIHLTRRTVPKIPKLFLKKSLNFSWLFQTSPRPNRLISFTARELPALPCSHTLLD